MRFVGFGVLIFSRIPYELLDPRPCLGEDGTLGQDRKVCVLLFWTGLWVDYYVLCEHRI